MESGGHTSTFRSRVKISLSMITTWIRIFLIRIRHGHDLSLINLLILFRPLFAVVFALVGFVGQSSIR